MALFLYGKTALDVMRYIRATSDGEIEGRSARPRRLGHALYTHRQLNELDETAVRLLSHSVGPAHVLVPHKEQMTRTKRLVTHLRSTEVPSGSYLNLGHDIYLPKPGFLLLQLANSYDEVALIALGLELCGFYSKWGFPKGKIHPSVEDEFRECTFSLRPATTVAKLAKYVGQQRGERGYSRAKHALARILNNSASPMESATYLLLCLPRRLGGWGLPAPILNAKVSVSTSTSTTVRYPDLYWPTHSLDVEYDSDQDHTDQWSRYRDAMRQVELAAEYITVLPLTRAQLMDPYEFEAFAASVRRNLGKRSRPLSSEWRSNYAKLRRRLL